MILHQVEALVKVRPSTRSPLSPIVPVDALRRYEARRVEFTLISRESQAGVKDIVLAVNYRPEVMVALLSKCEAQYDIKITFSVETEPLGTGPCHFHSFLTFATNASTLL